MFDKNDLHFYLYIYIFMLFFYIIIISKWSEDDYYSYIFYYYDWKSVWSIRLFLNHLYYLEYYLEMSKS